MSNIAKNQQRSHMFHYLARHARKGIKGCFEKIIVSNEYRVEQTTLDRKAIEKISWTTMRIFRKRKSARIKHTKKEQPRHKK